MAKKGSELFGTIIPSLNLKHCHIYDDHNEDAIKAFEPYIVNKCYAQGLDTLMFAATMNLYQDMPKRWVYDFYFYGLDKKQRWNKWFKSEKIDDIQYVREYYQCSLKRAKEYYTILDEQEVDYIKSTIEEKRKTTNE